MRHVGQRVAAVVAETAEAADAACALVEVDYEVLPAVTDPEAARSPGAPLLHPDRTPAERVDQAHRNVIAAVHTGDATAALAASHTVVSGTWRTSRVTHAQLETHGSIGWLDEDGRLVIRSSTQVPFLTRNELCHVFGLEPGRVRVLTARLGGGFGGKQEMFTEDLVALAVLRTGRPVAFEFTRADEFARAAVRHPMRVSVTLGADATGRLTAMKLDVLSDTGAYGNHSRGVLFHSLAESTTLYRCPTVQLDAEAVYTNTVPSGAFRGYGLGQVILGWSPRWTCSPRISASTRSTCAGSTPSDRPTRPVTTTSCGAATGWTSASTSRRARWSGAGPRPASARRPPPRAGWWARGWRRR